MIKCWMEKTGQNQVRGTVLHPILPAQPILPALLLPEVAVWCSGFAVGECWTVEGWCSGWWDVQTSSGSFLASSSSGWVPAAQFPSLTHSMMSSPSSVVSLFWARILSSKLCACNSTDSLSCCLSYLGGIWQWWTIFSPLPPHPMWESNTPEHSIHPCWLLLSNGCATSIGIACHFGLQSEMRWIPTSVHRYCWWFSSVGHLHLRSSSASCAFGCSAPFVVTMMDGWLVWLDCWGREVGCGVWGFLHVCHFHSRRCRWSQTSSQISWFPFGY